MTPAKRPCGWSTNTPTAATPKPIGRRSGTKTPLGACGNTGMKSPRARVHVGGRQEALRQVHQGVGQSKLSVIRKADLTALHAKIGRDNGHYQANRVLALVRAMFNKADDIGFHGTNPAKGVAKFKEEKRDRFLQAGELPKFFAALNAEPNEDFRDAFTLAILTGARRGNVLAMRWEDIDLQRGLWSIPAAVAKAGVTIVVPLVAPAVTLLEGRRKAAAGSPWVFPSTSKAGHLVETKSAWKRILDRAGLSNVRMHDLRRTLGSWQALLGSSLPIIGKSLGHTQASTTQVYARLTVDPVRESVDRATTAILDAASRPVEDNTQETQPSPETPTEK